MHAHTPRAHTQARTRETARAPVLVLILSTRSGWGRVAGTWRFEEGS